MIHVLFTKGEADFRCCLLFYISLFALLYFVVILVSRVQSLIKVTVFPDLCPLFIDLDPVFVACLTES